MKLRTFCTVALLLAFATTASAAPIVIKFSHVVAPDTPKGKGALLNGLPRRRNTCSASHELAA